MGASSIPPGEMRRLVEELYAAWASHEPDRIDPIFTADAVYEDVAGDRRYRGKEEIKRILRAAFEWAPDFRVTLTSLTVGTDAAATEWVIEGTQTGPLGELPAGGKRFRLRGASVILFQNGKIDGVTDYYDMATFLKQL